MTIYADDFNRSNGAIGSDYTAMTGLSIPVVNTNQVAAGSAASFAARVTAVSFGDNQRANIRLKACSTNCGIMAGVRFQPAAMNGYAFQVTGAIGASQAWRLKRITANAETLLASGTMTTAANDIISCSAVGNVITGYLNGAIIIQAVDTTYPTGGSPGIYLFGSSAIASLAADDFSCTDEGFVSDNMTRANDTSLGVNYTQQYGLSDLKILSNKAVPTNYGADCGSLWDTSTFANDQSAEIIVGALGSPGIVGAGVGVLLRGSLGLETFYRCYGSLISNSIKITRRLAGVGSTLATLTGAGLAVGDILRFDATGTTLTAFKNGAQILQVTDGNITSGLAGVTYSSTDSGTTDSIAAFNAYGSQPISGAVTPDWAGAFARVIRNLP